MKKGSKFSDEIVEGIVREYLERKAQGLPIKPLLTKHNISRQNLYYWIPHFADKIKGAKLKPLTNQSVHATPMKHGTWPVEAVEAINELKSVIRYLEKKVRELEEPQAARGFRNLTTNPG